MNIDLNADLGEGGPHDRELLQLITSANISCGAHAGSPADIDAAIRHALRHEVAIGAHPSYPDRENFGRKPMRMGSDALRRTLEEQLQDLRQRVHAEGGSLHHVKPHGALYNQAAHDRALAELICDAVETLDGDLTVVGLAGSRFIEVARHRGLRVLAEAFADRRYSDDGSLVSRADPAALLAGHEEVARQGLALATGAPIRSAGGGTLVLSADTICLHGDRPGALESARHLRDTLESAGVTIRPPPGLRN